MEIDRYTRSSGGIGMSSSAGFNLKSANCKVRKLLGRAYLHENRVSEALEVYLGILKDYPDDADVLMILGNLYRLAGSPGSAERLYSRVLEKNPEDQLAERQAEAAREETHHDWETEDPLSGEAIQNLAGCLQSKDTPALVVEIQAAADMLERIMTDDQQGDHNGTSHRAEDVQQLMPALIALNIRQARAEGYPDLAEALQSLQINLARQVEDRWADDLLKEESPLVKGPDE